MADFSGCCCSGTRDDRSGRYSGKLADRWGRKKLFLLGFAALAIRNALTIVSHNQYYLIGLTLVTADLAKGTGRFNLLQGAVQSAMGLGGVLSNSLFGLIAKVMGFNASFGGLAAMAVVGGVLYQWRMPETKPDDTQ